MNESASLRIDKSDGQYVAREIDDVGVERWKQATPVSHDDLFRILRARRWHTDDIHQAFAESDPEILRQVEEAAELRNPVVDEIIRRLREDMQQ